MASSTIKCYVDLTNGLDVVTLNAGNGANAGISFASPNIVQDMLVAVMGTVNALRFVKAPLSATTFSLQENWSGSTVANIEVRIASSGAAIASLTAAVKDLIATQPAIDSKFDKAGGAISGDTTVAGTLGTTKAITVNTGATASGTQVNMTRNSLSSGASFGVDGGGTIGVGATAGDTVLRVAGGTSVLRIAASDGTIKGTWDTATGLALTGTISATGQITSGSDLRVTKAGSNSFAVGPYLYLADAAAANGMLLQLNASNGLDIFSSGAYASPLVRLTATGAFTANGSLQAGSGLASSVTPKHYMVATNDDLQTALEVRQGRYNKDVIVATSNQTLSAAFFKAIENGTTCFQVGSGGAVTNIGNSYGAISERRFKENITKASRKLAKLLQFNVVNFNLVDDPGKLRQLGLIVDEVEQISPGLIDYIPDYADVVIEPERVERLVEPRQRTERRAVIQTVATIEVIDGRAIRKLRPERVEVDVPVVIERLIFDEAGEPVMVVMETAQDAVLDADGKVLVPAKPPVLRQAIYQEPVLDEEVVEITVPAKIERRPTGTHTKGIKYSVINMMMLIGIQEQQEIIQAQAAQLEQLAARVEALETP